MTTHTVVRWKEPSDVNIAQYPVLLNPHFPVISVFQCCFSIISILPLLIFYITFISTTFVILFKVFNLIFFYFISALIVLVNNPGPWWGPELLCNTNTLTLSWSVCCGAAVLRCWCRCEGVWERKGESNPSSPQCLSGTRLIWVISSYWRPVWRSSAAATTTERRSWSWEFLKNDEAALKYV